MGKKIKFVQEKNNKIKQGSSARSIIDLGLKKNYFPIAITTCNIFFIHNKFKKIVTTLDRLNTSELLQDLSVNYLFYDYDTNIMSAKKSVLVYILNIYPFKIFNKFFIRFDKFIHEPIKYLSYLIKKLVYPSF
jgi:hypothetical protein